MERPETEHSALIGSDFQVQRKQAKRDQEDFCDLFTNPEKYTESLRECLAALLLQPALGNGKNYLSV